MTRYTCSSVFIIEVLSVYTWREGGKEGAREGGRELGREGGRDRGRE